MRWLLMLVGLLGIALTTQLPSGGSAVKYAGWGDFEWDDDTLWARADNTGDWETHIWDHFQWA